MAVCEVFDITGAHYGTEAADKKLVKSSPGRYFNVRHDCFARPWEGGSTYHVEQHRGRGHVVFSGAVKLWWTNANSDHDDVGAFGRRSNDARDGQFQIRDVLVFPLTEPQLPPHLPRPSPPLRPPSPPTPSHPRRSPPPSTPLPSTPPCPAPTRAPASCPQLPPPQPGTPAPSLPQPPPHAPPSTSSRLPQTASSLGSVWAYREVARPDAADSAAGGSTEVQRQRIESDSLVTAALALSTLLCGLLSCSLCRRAAWRQCVGRRAAARLRRETREEGELAVSGTAGQMREATTGKRRSVAADGNAEPEDSYVF